MQRMIHNLNEYAQVDLELDQYKQKFGELESQLTQMIMSAQSLGIHLNSLFSFLRFYM